MRAPMFNPALLLLVALVGAGCGAEPERVPCCGDDVETPDEPPAVAVLEPGQPATSDPSDRADYLLDFGTAAIGETARGVFPLENRGQAPLHVSVGSPPAPFAIAVLPTEIPAGGAAVIRFEFEPTESGPAETILMVSGADRTFSVRLLGAGAMPALDCPKASTMVGFRGHAMRAEIHCSNPTDVGFSLQAEATSPFVVLAGAAWVGNGEGVTFGVAADTSVVGRRVGTLEIVANAGGVADVELEWIVQEPPSIRCDDGPLDFGEVVVGMHVPPRRITCHNEGDTTAGPFEISSSDPAFTPTLRADAVSPGSSFDIEIAFAPPMPGQYAAAIAFSMAGGVARTQVDAVGSAIVLPPCELTVLPDASVGLDFFDVQVGSRAVRELVLRSGAEACAIRDISVVGAASFWSPVARDAPHIILDADAELRLPVTFHPDTGGEFEASLHFRVSDPAAEDRAIPLRGHAVDDCLTIPGGVLFTSGIPGCQQWTETVQVRNDCAEPLVFLGATAHNTGNAAPGFQVVEQPATPITLAPGASLDLELAFQDASLEQRIHGGFTLAFDSRADRWLQATLGGADTNLRADKFVIPDPPVDTLFLREHPVLSGDTADLRTDFTIYADGDLLFPVYQGAEVWTYDAAQNAIVMGEYFIPKAGTRVEVWYLRSCF